MLKPMYIGGGEAGSASFCCPSVYIHQHGFEESYVYAESSVEHLFGGLFFKIAESCTRPIAISMWEIKGVHYSLEGRKMVLREKSLVSPVCILPSYS